MKKSRSNPFSRRAALKAAAGCGMMSNVAVMSQFINLQATKAMAATTRTRPTHKAIVCVFLAGAIDSYNWLSPYQGTDTTGERGSYLTARNGQRNPGNPYLPGYNPGIGLGLRKGGATFQDNDYLTTQISGGAAQRQSPLWFASRLWIRGRPGHGRSVSANGRCRRLFIHRAE